MSDKRIQTFPVPGLEYIFVPPGLPLIAKGATEPATTSLLVRGGAGTGKTTLAVALAHAVAKEQEGLVLYLTTEFVPTELVYKMRTLGLPEGLIIELRRPPKELQAGAILVEHLMRTEAGKDVQTGGERKRAAINAIWEVLDGQKDHGPKEGPSRPPVRAIVIDAFGLPDAEPADPKLRGELLALIQTLEINGVSTIFVEEAGPASEHWFPFVTDVVFELELSPDPETGELLRKLKCPKSRYATAIPGPHEYGLDNGIPTVWPDIVSSGAFRTKTYDKNQVTPAVFLPLATKDEYAICPAGSVLLSEYDRESLIDEAFSTTPGLRLAHVDCGSLPRILLPSGNGIVSPGSGTPISLGWTLIKVRDAGMINSVFFQGLDYYRRTRYRSVVDVFHMIEMLRTAGITVCVHGQTSELEALNALADYSSSTLSGRIRRSLPRVRPCSAARWAEDIWKPFAPQGNMSFADTIKTIKIEMATETTTPAELMTRANHINYTEPQRLTDAERLDAASLLHLLGDTNRVNGVITDISGRGQLISAYCAQIQAWMGEDLEAARTCLSRKRADFFYTGLWDGLSAVYAHNNAVTLESIQLNSTSSLLPYSLFWRALASRKRFDRIDELTHVLAQNFGFPAWFVVRMEADGRLENGDKTVTRDALVRLEKLATDEQIPPIHRAEILYNLGVAKERLGNLSGAVSAYKLARTINPYLEAATNALVGLGSL